MSRNGRYMVVKLFEAAEAAVGQFYSAWREKAPSPIQEAISSFQEAYKKPLTSAIYIAGEISATIRGTIVEA